MTLRGRLIAVGALVAVVLASGILILVRSRTPDCTVAAPRPSLAPALRALGDFDQAYDAGNAAALEDAAARAASALYGDLIGTAPEAPVAIAAATPGSPDAVVVPLRSHLTGSGPAPLAGLVVFLRDCQGSAYFDTVEDDASTQPALTEFPPVTREQASAQLGSAGVRLEYATSPLRPQWVTVTDPVRSFPAR
ncbi:MAG: hypothetical protein DLM65_15110 [Candidatus Aeolococcus gillhamiae]|uniref:Uncharacterized protein n=1 Tax=Candidatus Aeolococcus gillhamiae TaxID=3127015 RepID=A0A2W5ZWF8_9BACT|nr:MAG: hypothetical protein DLM65_15110 [Candidatus Dormibacter sp. RRmetagenome_bin12]